MNTYIEVVYRGDEADTEQKKLLNQSTFVITDVFDRMAGVRLNGVQKIHIKLTNRDEEFKAYDAQTDLKIISLYMPFDFSHYQNLDKINKRAYLTQVFYNALKQMCAALNYDCQPFRQAYEKVKELNYQNTYIHGKLKTAPDRQHKAGVHIRVEEEFAEISALLQDAEGNEVGRILLMRPLPHSMFIYKFIHSTKWLDKERFQVSDKSGQVVFTVNVPEETAEMYLLPKTKGLPELVQEVAMAAADDFD